MPGKSWKNLKLYIWLQSYVNENLEKQEIQEEEKRKSQQKVNKNTIYEKKKKKYREKNK